MLTILPSPDMTSRRCDGCHNWERHAATKENPDPQWGFCFGVPPQLERDAESIPFPCTTAAWRCPLWLEKAPAVEPVEPVDTAPLAEAVRKMDATGIRNSPNYRARPAPADGY